LTPVFKNILYETLDEVAKITINRPPLNVLNTETTEEMIRALEIANKDDTVMVVVITGSGDRAFCAGVDIKDHLPEKIGKTLELFHRMFYVLVDLQKPTVAMVNGFALGGGCELVIACDLAIASEGAQFGQPEIKVGAIPTVAAALLPKLIGRKNAFELIFTGDSISAKEAQQIGLINRVVPADKIVDATNELVNKFKEKSPVVLKLLRRAVYQGLHLDFKKALDGVSDIYLSQLMRTEDAVEGLKAFLEKRKPKWKGK